MPIAASRWTTPGVANPRRWLPRNRQPPARQVIAHGDADEEGQEQERDAHDGEHEALAVADVHEVKDDERRLHAGDPQGERGVQRTHLDERHGDRHRRQSHQGGEDREVDLQRNDVVFSGV